MHFIIFDKETLERLYAYQAESKQLFGGKWGSDQVVHLEVPEELDADTVKIVATTETQDVVITPEQNIPAVTTEEPILDGEGNPVLDENGNPTFNTVIVEEAYTIPAVTEEQDVTTYTLEADPVLLAEKQLKIKEDLVTEAYNRMNDEIYAEMYRVAGTTKSDSAIADLQQFKTMKSAPSRFVGKIVRRPIGDFTLGHVFASEQEVIDYASAKLGEGLDYDVYRDERIWQFYVEREAILNS